MKKGEKYLYKHPNFSKPVEVVVADAPDESKWAILELNSSGELGWKQEDDSRLHDYMPIFVNSKFWSVCADDKDILPYPTEPIINNYYSII